MKEQIAQIETVLKAIAAEDNKRDKTLPPNPHLADATVRGRLMLTSLNRYLVEAAKAAEAVKAAEPAKK
jgi:hypothetical protein